MNYIELEEVEEVEELSEDITEDDIELLDTLEELGF